MSFNVPTIDISAYVEHRSEDERAADVAAALDVAATHPGRVTCRSSAMASRPRYRQASLRLSDDFFGLPLDEKKQRTRCPTPGTAATARSKANPLSLSLGVNRRVG